MPALADQFTCVVTRLARIGQRDLRVLADGEQVLSSVDAAAIAPKLGAGGLDLEEQPVVSASLIGLSAGLAWRILMSVRGMAKLSSSRAPFGTLKPMLPESPANSTPAAMPVPKSRHPTQRFDIRPSTDLAYPACCAALSHRGFTRMLGDT